MQSYSVYRDSDFNKDRYPYVHRPQSPFSDVLRKDQVSIAYNERCIPKLAELLVYPNLNCEKRRDALKTLNELVSNQELKAEMITHHIISYSSCLTVDDYWETRKEACLLLGSLLFLEDGRRQYKKKQDNYLILHQVLFDNNVKVRIAVGWLIYRLSIHKDGVNMINESNTIFKIIDAINTYSVLDVFSINHHYLIYLLGSMINLTMYEPGINNSLGKGLLATFYTILDDKDGTFSKQVNKGAYQQIKEYILSIIKNMMLLKEGKTEALKVKIVRIITRFLTSEIDRDRLFSSAFMMAISNDIIAKQEISNYVSESGKYEIIEVSKF